jgi:hypothetical protein
VSEEFACVTEAVMERNVVPITVELNVEIVLLAKPASMESVQELVLLSVFELTVASGPVVGIDATEMVVVVLVLTAILATSVVVTELANVSLIVTTSTVVMMVVEDPVEPVSTELSAKELTTSSLDNATTTATLT